MSGEDADGHGAGETDACDTCQQPHDQQQATDELGATRHDSHQHARLEAKVFSEELPGALETVATEPAEELLCAVRDHHNANPEANREEGCGVGCREEGFFDVHSMSSFYF